MSQDNTYKKTILLGKSGGYITTLTLKLGEYVSFTHDSYSDQFFNEEYGEEYKEQYVEENAYDYWKEAVASDQTERSFDDWKEDYMDSEDWMDVMGDVIEVDYNLYTMLQGCGACIWDHVVKDCDYRNIEIPKLTKEEFDYIIESDFLHLKTLDRLNNEEKSRVERLVQIFDKYKAFEYEDLKEFSNKEEEIQNEA